MKARFLTLLCAITMVLGGCAQSTQERTITEQPGEIESKQMTEWPVNSEQPFETTSSGPATEQSGEENNEPLTEIPTDTEQPAATPAAENSNTEELTIAGSYSDDDIYIGEYLDSDNNEPNLEIDKDDDGKYIVQIGIFRLTLLSDGIGELTADGLTFTATDAAGNPISGVITVEDQIATVIFTNSTWGYLPNGSSFQYTKSSDIPDIWDY